MLLCLLACAGCGDDGAGDGGTTTLDGGSSSGGAPPNAAPTVVAQVDATAACGQAGATRVELHATRIGCKNPPPAPCTLPNPPRPTVGEGFDCPADGSPQTLRVELTQTGRYHVEVLTMAADAELSRACWGEGGQVELLVTEEHLDDKPTFVVEPLDGTPCG